MFSRREQDLFVFEVSHNGVVVFFSFSNDVYV